MSISGEDEPIIPLEYARPADPQPGQYKWAGIAAAGLVVGLFNAATTMCMCGYLGRQSILGNAVAFALASVGFLRFRGHLLMRIAVSVVFIFVSLLVFQNIHNVLWSGHDPLFR